MLRFYRPDLACGLGGFALGAAALLMSPGVQGRVSPLPRGDTNILEQAQAATALPPPGRRG